MNKPEEYLETKVTRIGKRFHCRLINKNTKKVLSEVACAHKIDIGFCFEYMLRWHDKCGGTSPMASASRDRPKYNKPEGKIWYHMPVNR